MEELKARIYQLAEAAEISLQLGFSTKVENQPKEAQLRPLAQVPESVRKEIWEEANAKLTAQRPDYFLG